MPKKPFKPVTCGQTELLELMHSNLADFKNTSSKGGQRYYLTFIEDCSGYTKVHLLRSKNEVEEIFLKYKVEVKNKLDQ